MLKELSPYIQIIPETTHPLSADVGIIESKNAWWIYDVGASEEARDIINSLYGKDGKKVNIVISHFHCDHTKNLSYIKYDNLYVGEHTYKRRHMGTIVKEPLEFNDGIEVKIIPLPASHAKGCLALEVNGEYTFLGDGTYCGEKPTRRYYNAGLLLEEIRTLQRLESPFVFLSHDRLVIRKKDIVIMQLQQLYDLRKGNEPYIWL